MLNGGKTHTAQQGKFPFYLPLAWPAADALARLVVVPADSSACVRQTDGQMDRQSLYDRTHWV